FPTVVSEQAGESAAARQGGPNLSLRILLVEDHLDTRRVMTRLLSSLGCTVETAGSVAEAIELSNKEKFDLLVSDIGLPDGSGVEIMRHIRARSRDIKGVALSGYGQPEDIRRSKEAGFNA